jgi:hypothetical protein
MAVKLAKAMVSRLFSSVFVHHSPPLRVLLSTAKARSLHERSRVKERGQGWDQQMELRA